MPRILPLLALQTVLLVTAPGGSTRTVRIEASRDATLVEDPDGALADGTGPYVRAGRTSQMAQSRRRALLYFDVAAALPRNAKVESVTLNLHMSQTNAGPVEVAVHRVLAEWKEGPSFSMGGIGTRSERGDVTWLHNSYAGSLWVKPGAEFIPHPSAERTVDRVGPYTWTSTDELEADVRLWSEAPHRNFGWVLVGDESSSTSVKRFDSRESDSPSLRPTLEVTYRL